MLKSRGETLTQFLNRFSCHDYVQNDHRVSQWLKRQIQTFKKRKIKKDQKSGPVCVCGYLRKGKVWWG